MTNFCHYFFHYLFISQDVFIYKGFLGNPLNQASLARHT